MNIKTVMVYGGMLVGAFFGGAISSLTGTPPDIVAAIIGTSLCGIFGAFLIHYGSTNGIQYKVKHE